MPEPAGEPRHRHPVRAIAMSSTPFHAFAAGGPMQARAATGTLQAAATDALDAVVTLLPRLLGFLAVLAVGWMLASLLARGVRAVLQAAGFDDLARRSGVAAF